MPRSPQNATDGRRGGGGRARGQHEVQDLTDEVEKLMLYGTSRDGIARALKDEKGAPMPIGTVDDYIRRVKDRWLAETPLEREQTRQRQLRRLYGQLRTLQVKGRAKDVVDRERLIAKIEGNEAPSTIELGGRGGKPIEREFPEVLKAFKKLAGEE